MKHLVLGSEGQIGKYVCDEIERNGDQVIRRDIKLNPAHDLRSRTLLDAAMFGKIMENADFVHFLAFDVGGSTYLQKNQDSLQYIVNNVRIMDNVFHYLAETRKPFYFASSQMANMPESVYGQLKALGERYTSALGGINLRFWNIYGYESDPEKTHVITDFVRMALDTGRILCRTDGNEERHFTHALDAADMLYRITQKYDEIPKDKVFPLAPHNNDWVKIRDVAKTVANLIPGTRVYYMDEPDRTQSKWNSVSALEAQALVKILYPRDGNKPRRGPLPYFEYYIHKPSNSMSEDFRTISLTEGITDIIERMRINDRIL